MEKSPSVYLSPSVQDYNEYIIGGSEEYYMNLIADAMVPYLRASNIAFTRNNPNDSLSQVIDQSNVGDYDLHVALHTNSSPENISGILQGPDVYYYAYSTEGEKAANIFAKNLTSIYPHPDLVTVIPNTTLAELRRARATAILLELAYHDNYQDATWIAESIDPTARNLVLSLTQYFGIPFIIPYA
ncbi:N-acetylmuramoyl-L-alanine amidase family protein [Clostridium aminobutyricum]|uniref:N-acetylmuramoyl-L-alanine amidase n=1 Tax=Clostridium aminobutyricum TaxID=33953 RepID=A0A939IG91_CLOAM|nr:N-acetylmuramoyl-L-alanine amidase [Clostridium aminobutyricum]MBN7772915.1 N-acetylmuramoyl-L-alanine amidase [Clostridium aminobutyricum]